MKINKRNIEVILFRYKEGLLSPDQTAQVKLLLEHNTEWQKLADMYEPSLRITADTSTVYPNKERLRQIAAKTPHQPKALPIWSKMSAAACILLLLSLGLHLILHNDTDTQTTMQQTVVAENKNKPIATHSDTLCNAPATLCAKRIAIRTKPIENTGNQPSEDIVTTSVEPVYSDQLITYIDEDDTTFNSKFLPFDLAMSTNDTAFARPVPTDLSITYIPTDTDSAADFSPKRNYAVNDWINSIRLSHIEFQTSIVNQFCKIIEK